VAHHHRQVRVLDLAQSLRRSQHPAQLLGEGVDHAIPPEHREQILRILVADRRQSSNERLVGKPRALLDVPEHQRVHGAAENLGGEAPHREVATHQGAGLVKDVLDSLSRGSRCLCHAPIIAKLYLIIQYILLRG